MSTSTNLILTSWPSQGQWFLSHFRQLSCSCMHRLCNGFYLWISYNIKIYKHISIQIINCVFEIYVSSVFLDEILSIRVLKSRELKASSGPFHLLVSYLHIMFHCHTVIFPCLYFWIFFDFRGGMIFFRPLWSTQNHQTIYLFDEEHKLLLYFNLSFETSAWINYFCLFASLSMHAFFSFIFSFLTVMIFLCRTTRLLF